MEIFFKIGNITNNEHRITIERLIAQFLVIII